MADQGMDWGVLLGVISAVGLPLTLGLTFPTNTPGEYRIARSFFVAFALASVASVIGLSFYDWGALWMKLIVNSAVAALAAAIATYGVNWLNHKETAAIGPAGGAKTMSKDDDAPAKPPNMGPGSIYTDRQSGGTNTVNNTIVQEDRSPKARFRRLMDSVDPQIMRAIRSGQTQLMIRMQPDDIAALNELLSTPEGQALAVIKGYGGIMTQSVIMNGTLGPSGLVPVQRQVMLEVNPAVLAP